MALARAVGFDISSASTSPQNTRDEDAERPAMKGHHNRSVIVARRAQGIPGADVFDVVDQERPHAIENTVVVKLLYVSVDPGMRGWVSTEQNYLSVPPWRNHMGPGCTI
jgi:N-terminal domain of oxidoreductase